MRRIQFRLLTEQQTRCWSKAKRRQTDETSVKLGFIYTEFTHERGLIALRYAILMIIAQFATIIERFLLRLFSIATDRHWYHKRNSGFRCCLTTITRFGGWVVFLWLCTRKRGMFMASFWEKRSRHWILRGNVESPTIHGIDDSDWSQTSVCHNYSCRSMPYNETANVNWCTACIDDQRIMESSYIERFCLGQNKIVSVKRIEQKYSIAIEEKGSLIRRIELTPNR